MQTFSWGGWLRTLHSPGDTEVGGCEASSHLSRQKLFLESELKVMGGWYWGRWGLWFEL